MSRAIVGFYSGWRADSAGRTLDDIRNWDHNRLERTHDYIQWLFPLRERSQANPSAPVLDDDQIRAFRADEQLQRELLKSFDRMLGFYGFQRTGACVERSAAWEERSANWLTAGNHNMLRITRILKSLSILGLRQYATAFFEALEHVYASDAGRTIGEVTYRHWKDAASTMSDD